VIAMIDVLTQVTGSWRSIVTTTPLANCHTRAHHTLHPPACLSLLTCHVGHVRAEGTAFLPSCARGLRLASAGSIRVVSHNGPRNTPPLAAGRAQHAV
jgi:hypothetical protein